MRRFVIQFYPADDSVAIYEPAIRNSGIMGGKFLSRFKHKKPDGSACCSQAFPLGCSLCDPEPTPTHTLTNTHSHTHSHPHTHPHAHPHPQPHPH
jgi:hypothetical protein